MVNDFYARDGSRRVRTGYRQKQKEGIVTIPPFGYFKDKNTKKVVIVEEAAETVRLIFSGEVSVYGKRIPRLTPHRCIQSGIGLLPESRKENGLTLILPIFQNITAAALEKISSGGVLGLRKEKKIAEDYIQKLSVACPGAYQLPLYLSGGNQQKVVLGKWLFTESKVLIFDEPTRGIDIGARDEIYRMIDDLAKSGVSILIISSDLPEIMTIADRVCVMREGRIVADLDIADASQEIIASYAAGGKHE